MKEFNLVLNETINKGLRPFKRLPLNVVWLEQANNVEVSEVGITGLTLPASIDLLEVYQKIGLTFPYPQIKIINDVVYLFGASQIATYDVSTGEITIIDFDSSTKLNEPVVRIEL